MTSASAAAYLEAAGWVLGASRLARAAALDARYAPMADFAMARLLPRAMARCEEAASPEAVLALLG